MSHSIISTSGEKEPSQTLPGSQPADHNAPFSLNSLPCTLEQEEEGVATTVASRTTAIAAAADTSIPTCSWNVTLHKTGAQGLWGPCLSPMSTWWNSGHASITSCCPQVLQHTKGLGEVTAWSLTPPLYPFPRLPVLLYIWKTHTDGPPPSFPPGSPIHTIVLPGSLFLLSTSMHFSSSVFLPLPVPGPALLHALPHAPWASSPLPAPLHPPGPSPKHYCRQTCRKHPRCPSPLPCLCGDTGTGGGTGVPDPRDALSPSLWGGQHHCQGDVSRPRWDSTAAPLGPLLPFHSQQDKLEEEAEQEPAQNTSTWGQWQSVSSRLHSPYLYSPSAVGYYSGSSRVYNQVATSFSTTAIMHSATVPIKHLILEQQQWSASQEAPRLLPPCHHPPQKPQHGSFQRQWCPRPWQWPLSHNRFSSWRHKPFLGRQWVKGSQWGALHSPQAPPGAGWRGDTNFCLTPLPNVTLPITFPLFVLKKLVFPISPLLQGCKGQLPLPEESPHPDSAGRTWHGELQSPLSFKIRNPLVHPQLLKGHSGLPLVSLGHFWIDCFLAQERVISPPNCEGWKWSQHKQIPTPPGGTPHREEEGCLQGKIVTSHDSFLCALLPGNPNPLHW